MTVTLDLAPEIDQGLLAQAQAKGVSLIDYLQEVVEREAHLAAPTGAQHATSEARNLVELFVPIRGLFADGELDLSRSLSRAMSNFCTLSCSGNLHAV